jgi:hypothetical protein
MADENKAPAKISTVAVTPDKVEELIRELRNRLMLVTDQTLNHLRAHDLIPRMERAANCCKPDGGTCCVNKKTV